MVVNHPGGVILHLKDGSAEYFGYGARVDEDQLAEYQRENLGDFTDDKDRTAYTQESVEHRAHVQAALTDAGQPNSTSDAVPGNYGELSEDEAAQLVLALQADPQSQARILLHERVHHGGRQLVIDAGSSAARQEADRLYEALEAGHTQFGQTRLESQDTERDLERQARRSEKSGARRSSGGKTPPPQGG